QNSGGQTQCGGVPGQECKQVKGIRYRAVGSKLDASGCVVGVDAVICRGEDGVLDGDDLIESARLHVARERRHPRRIGSHAGGDRSDDGELHVPSPPVAARIAAANVPARRSRNTSSSRSFRPFGPDSGTRQFGYSSVVPGWFWVRRSPTASVSDSASSF